MWSKLCKGRMMRWRIVMRKVNLQPWLRTLFKYIGYHRIKVTWFLLTILLRQVAINHIYCSRRERFGVNQHLGLLWKLKLTIIDPTLDDVSKYHAVVGSMFVGIVAFAIHLSFHIFSLRYIMTRPKLNDFYCKKLVKIYIGLSNVKGANLWCLDCSFSQCCLGSGILRIGMS